MKTFIREYLKKYSKSREFIIYISLILISMVLLVLEKTGVHIYQGVANEMLLISSIVTVVGILMGFVFSSLIQLGSLKKKMNMKYDVVSDTFYRMSFSLVASLSCMVAALFYIMFPLILTIHVPIALFLVVLISILHSISDYILILRNDAT